MIKSMNLLAYNCLDRGNIWVGNLSEIPVQTIITPEPPL